MGITLPSIPIPPTCPSFLDDKLGIVLYYKDKTAFILGATVKFKKIGLPDRNAILTGVLYHQCSLKGIAVGVSAQKFGIDFGKGVGNEAVVGTTTVFDKTLKIFRFPDFVSTTPFTCPTVTPTIIDTGFSSTTLTALPNITVPPLTGYVIGVGVFNVTEGTFNIELDNTPIISKASIPSTGKIDVNLPTIAELFKKVPSLVGKTSATVKVIITWYHCTFTNSKIVRLPTFPCTGNFVQPNMSSLLSGITSIATIPSSLIVPLKLTGNKTSVPFEIWIGGIRIAKQPIASNEFDLIKIMKDAGISKTTSQFYVTIKSLELDCKIPDLVIPVKLPLQIKLCDPPKIPSPITGECITPDLDSECVKYITRPLDSPPSHPKEITDFNATFYVYIHKMQSVCEANPGLTSPIPAGTPGTLTLGNITKTFYLGEGGILNIDLVRDLGFDLASLAGVTGGFAPPSVDVVQPPLPSVPGERVGNYCTIKPMITSFAGVAFFDVFHDTLGKIYSGNTYDQAKYKAQQDARCFPKAALPKVTISITHRNWSDPRNAVIGFKSSVRGSRYAEGDQAWGWGGNPKISDADYMKTVAIPRTMSYLGITRDEIAA